MLQRLRKSMQIGSFSKLSGNIEVDESWIGGKVRNMHKDRKARSAEEGRNLGGKTLELASSNATRSARYRSAKRTAKVIQQHIREHVPAGSGYLLR